MRGRPRAGREIIARVAAVALRRPRAAGALAVLLAIGCAVLAVGLTPDASPSLLTDPGKGAGKATPPQERAFGAEPIVIVAKGDLASTTLASQNLNQLLRLEGEVAKVPGVKQVFGPGTLINQSIVQIERVLASELGPVADRADKAAKAARAAARRSGASATDAQAAGEQARLDSLGSKRKEYEQLIVRFGYVGLPSLANRNFVMAIVYGARTTPKPRFSWLFPDNDHALVLVRPRAGLSDAQLRTLGTRLRALTAKAGMDGVKLSVAGEPLLVAGIADSFAKELLRLAPVVLVAMLLVLWLGLRRGRRRTRLLLLAGGSVLATAAASRILGLGLTPATVAALPVVLGLAVDYGVQLQVRYWRERAEGRTPRRAAGEAVVAVGPTLAAAAVAMSVGFLSLTLSSVPLVDRLGETLAVGTLLAVALVIVFGGPLLAWRDAGGATAPELPIATGLRQWTRTGAIVLTLATACAVAGLATASGTRVQSDVAQLAPHGLDELKAVQGLQHDLGVGGTLRLAVTGRDVTDPRVVAWEARLQDKVLGLHAGLRPGPNLGGLISGDNAGTDPATIRSLVSLLPKYFLEAVVTPDRHRGEMSFTIPLVDVHQQAAILARIRPLLRDAPDGVHVEPAGLTAQAVASVKALDSTRPSLLLIAALLVFAVLLALHRRLDRALLPLVPALLTAGVAALLVRASGTELSPLGAGLEPLVLAVGVEFGLLLDARYHEARRDGATPSEAQAAAMGHVGAAVAVSAATVALAFATLAVSRMELLRQFGLLVALEVTLCAVLAVWLVPALAASLERWRLERREPAAPRRRRTVRPVGEVHEVRR